MARATIRELGQLYWIVGSPRAVAVQTPAHVHHLRVPGDFNLGHIAMTALTVQPCCDVRTMYEMDKVRHLGDGNPGNLLIV